MLVIYLCVTVFIVMCALRIINEFKQNLDNDLTKVFYCM